MAPMNARLLRPTASGFDPRRISGLAAWWDSTDNSKITTATGVTTWVDKSANAFSLSQGTGTAQPTISNINGRQAFAYNGSQSQFLSSTDAGLLAIGTTSTNTAPTYTAFYVLSVGSTQVSLPVAWGRSTSDTPFHGPIHPTNQSGSFWRASYRTDAGGTQFTNGSGTYATNTPYAVSSALSTAGIVGRANGIEVVNLAVPSGDLTVTTNRFAVGCLLRASASTFVTGTIGDVLIYNRVLSAAEIAAVERWLGSKFGISVT